MRKILSVEKSLVKFGEDIRTARLKRRLPQTIICERAGISIKTLRQLESGSAGVSIGNCAAVLFALGFDVPFSTIASYGNDPVGQALMEDSLPKRGRAGRL